MLDPNKGFRFDDSQFAFELVDGEVIVLEFAIGTYFAFGGSAFALWPAIMSGAPISQILDWVRGSFSGSTETADQDVEEFIAKLLEDGVFKQIGANGSATFPEPGPDLPPYSAPTYEKFTDMRDILTLDPIHDVDDRGWPHPPEAETTEA